MIKLLGYICIWLSCTDYIFMYNITSFNIPKSIFFIVNITSTFLCYDSRDSQCPRVKLSSQLQRVINPQPPPPVAVLPDSGIGNVR